MKRKLCPKKALAVVLAASLALSPTITASAASLENGENELAQTAPEDAGNGDESGKADEKSDSSSDSSTQEVKTDESEKSEQKAEPVAETTGEKAAEASSTESSSAETTEETPVAEETEATEEANTASDAEAPLFEKVDPAEEGLADPVTSIEGEEPELPVEEKNPDEQTRVIIVMEGDSVLDAGFDTENLAENDAAMNLSDSIVAEQEEQIEKISEEALDGEELEVNYQLSILANAVSADVAYKDIESIKEVDGVEAVYVAQKYVPLETADTNTITSGDMVGSYTTWATGYTGAGTRVAVIDTGIDADHPSFDGAAFEAHLAETAEEAGRTVEDYDLLDAEEISEVLPNLNASQRDEGVSADDLYLNEKIPFAFNYVDKNLDITHENDDEGDHGTHVAGIATANTYVPDASSETGFSRQEAGVVGIAPDSQLITMKVFGTNGGAYTDDYMAAIEDALLLKADVVNLSLGSSAAGYSSDSEAYINEIFKKLEGTSTVVSISAGNSGRWADDSIYGVNLSGDVNQDTVGSPGSYYNALTVASAVNSGFTGNYVITGDGEDVFYTPGNETLAPGFETLDTSEDQNGTELPFVFLKAKGTEADYEGLDVTDKIVFVQRGGLTFGEKQMNAEAAGAKAVVIYNNQPGTITMTLQGSTAVIPAVSITLAEGEAIAQTAEQVSENVYEGTITVVGKVKTNYNVADGYTMSDFSSFGVPGSLDLKPEITAPGGNIFSTRDNGTYGTLSGTSMAAPSVAGQSALVEQYIRENDLAEKNDISVRSLAQSLLMSTAVPLRTDNDPEAPEYSPRSQGAGLSNVFNAVTSPSYILVGEKEGNDGKAKVVLGDDPDRNGVYSFSFDVYNLTENPQYYNLDSSVLTEELFEDSGITFFAGQSHKLSPEVTLTADDTALVYDLNDDGKVNSKDRKVLLQIVNGTRENTLVAEHEDYFDFNKDGVVNTKDVYLFGKQIKNKEGSADFGLRVMRVKDSTRVDVTVNLSQSDREYLAGFENGIYVDGFIYVNGTVSLSVPFLAFYGSWMDSSMFENFDFMQYAHDEQYVSGSYVVREDLVGFDDTNFLTFFPLGTTSEKYYIPNMFATDEEYIADRNALSSLNGSVLGRQFYSLIRNANRVIFTIKDRNTGEKYFEHTEYENYASFIYNGQWQNYIQNQNLLWAGNDAEGNPLEDGTEVDVVVEAVPSYYDDVEDPSTLTGKGLYMSLPLTIDNTDPVITDAVKADDGKYEITLYDNRYSAAVLVLDRDGNILNRYAVNQKEKDVDTVVSIDAPEDVFYVEVFDYACNASVYRFNNTGHADTKFVDSLTVDKDSIELGVGRSAQIKATVGPKWLAEGYDAVEFTSSDDQIATVTQSGIVKAVAEGEATITVSTLATNKKGKKLTAEVKVTVTKTAPRNDASEVEQTSDDAAASDSASSASSEEATSGDDASNASSSEGASNNEQTAPSEDASNASSDSASESSTSDDEQAAPVSEVKEEETKTEENTENTENKAEESESDSEQKADESTSDNSSDESNKDDSAESGSTDESVNESQLGGEEHE